VILTVFPELKGEGASTKEAQQDLVALAVYVMDTFQVLADGTVLPYSCMTGHECRVHRLLLLRDTTAFGHHVMLLPWKVTQDELEQMIQQAMHPVTDLNHGRVGCEEVAQEQAVKTPAMDKATNEGGVDYAVTMPEGYGRVGLIMSEENAGWLSSTGEFRGCARNSESTSEPVSDATVDAEIAVDEAVAVEEAVAAECGRPCVTFSLTRKWEGQAGTVDAAAAEGMVDAANTDTVGDAAHVDAACHSDESLGV